jgi:hypothetical protein
MESVAAGDQVAGELVGLALMHVADHRLVAVKTVQRHVAAFEAQRRSGLQSRRH